MDERAGGKDNCYGFLRLFLACVVVVQHALALTGNMEASFLGKEPDSVFGSRVMYGDVAVGGFFALSGFLLYSSVRRHRPGKFIRLRFYRLFPGFWVALVAVALVLAPLIGVVGGTISSYRILGGEDSAITYILLNSALLIVQPSIGGVLEGVPYPYSLDGSFWTLLPEFCCYMALLAVWWAGGRFRWISGVRGISVAVVGSVALWPVAFVLGAGEVQKEVLTAVIGLPIAFFTGVLLGALNAPGRLAGMARQGVAVWCAAVTGLVLCVIEGWWMPAGPILLAVVVVVGGSFVKQGWFARVGTRNDFSYGIYLYHFPVLQLLATVGFAGIGAGLAVGVLVPVALVSTLPLAAASWWYVEKPALRFARRR